MNFVDRLKKETLLGDGAIGTMLQSLGLQFKVDTHRILMEQAYILTLEQPASKTIR